MNYCRISRLRSLHSNLVRQFEEVSSGDVTGKSQFLRDDLRCCSDLMDGWRKVEEQRGRGHVCDA
jgi:hypothetical protein